MEETEVPLEHLHEQLHHRAEHSGETWISWVALSTAILAVLAAIAGLLSGQHANEAMMNQIEASDQWNYYQAKSIKASVLDAKMSLAGVHDESDQSNRDRYEKEQEKIKSRSRAQGSRSEIKFSQARSVRAWRNHVPNRDCHCGDFRAHKETQILDREFDFWRCRLCVSGPGGNLRQG